MLDIKVTYYSYSFYSWPFSSVINLIEGTRRDLLKFWEVEIIDFMQLDIFKELQ